MKSVRECVSASHQAESDVRFLEYRLDVISRWPVSGRKRATAEAISRRLAAIGRSSLSRSDVDHLLAASCRLLDGLFSADNAGPPASESVPKLCA